MPLFLSIYFVFALIIFIKWLKITQTLNKSQKFVFWMLYLFMLPVIYLLLGLLFMNFGWLPK